jgi:hypothetical protein
MPDIQGPGACGSHLGLGRVDPDRSNLGFRQWALEVDIQQAIVESGSDNLNSFGQDEAPLKLAGGNSPVQVQPAFIISLPSSDHQLIILDLNRKIIHGETGNRQCYPQSVVTDLLYIVRGITLCRAFGDAVECTLKLVEPQQERTTEKRHAGCH